MNYIANFNVYCKKNNKTIVANNNELLLYKMLIKFVGEHKVSANFIAIQQTHDIDIVEQILEKIHLCLPGHNCLQFT